MSVRRAAFTLVELLLSLAILGVISTTIGLVLHAGIESWRASSDFLDEGVDGEAVMEQIVMALSSAYYPANGDPSYEYGFQHEDDGEEEAAKDSISWVKIGAALVGEDVSWAGSAHRVRLFVGDDGDPDGPGLYAAAWQTVGLAEDFDEEEDVEPVLLSDRVTALDVRMVDPEKAVEPGEPYEWLDEWTASNRLPTHVQVTLVLQPGRKDADPEVLRRLVDIPLSSVSWNPTRVDSPAGVTSEWRTPDGRSFRIRLRAGGGESRGGTSK